MSGVYCQICTTLPVDDRPEGRQCSSCGTYACNSHGSYVSFRWYCNKCSSTAKAEEKKEKE